MAAYGDFDTLVGALKKSTIDLWMKEQNYDLVGGEYVNASRGSDLKVSSPGADGEGGGDWSTDNFINEWLIGGDKDDHFRGGFAQIRASIDELVEPWRDLPDPADVAPIVETCRQVSRRLSTSASSENGSTTGGGQLAGTLGLIEQNLQAMSGQAIASFKDKFLSQLGSAVSGYHAISVARGANVAAQEGIWGEARQNVADVLVKAREEIDSVVDGGSSQWKQTLTVIGWAAKGLSMFVSGGATLPFQVAGLGIEILQDPEKERNDVDAPFSDSSGALSSLQTVLQALSDQIRVEEQAIVDNIEKNLSNIRADAASYDLSPPTLTAQDEVIAINPSLIEEITQTYMPSVKAELDAIASLALDCTTSSAVARDPAVGLGVYGPSYTLYDLTIMLYELVKNMGWEVEKGAMLLDLVLGDFAASEQEREDQLARLGQEIDAGSSYDPWD